MTALQTGGPTRAGKRQEDEEESKEFPLLVFIFLSIIFLSFCLDEIPEFAQANPFGNILPSQPESCTKSPLPCH
jgi:hypothetical protein